MLILKLTISPINQKMKVYLVLVIEATGQHYLGNDQLICIAYCVGTAEGIIESGQLLRPLRPGCQTLADYWKQRGFADIEFTYFWSRQENLDRLHQWSQLPLGPTVFDSEIELFTAFQALLMRLESNGHYCIVTDTTCYDTVWLDLGLRKFGFAGLNRSRDGTVWLNSLEIDSFLTGLVKRSLAELAPPPKERNHALSDNDAVDLFYRLQGGL